MGKRKDRKKKTRERIETDTVIDLDAQREARRRQLREAAAESRRKRGAREDEPGYDYYGYHSGGDTIVEETEDSQKSQKNTKKRKKGLTPSRIIILAAVLFIIICVFCSIWNIISLKVEEREARERIKELEAQKQELEQEVGKIGTEEYIEEQARRWLKMAKSGEIIYVFGDDDADGGA